MDHDYVIINYFDDALKNIHVFTHVCFFALADALREVSLMSAAAAAAAEAAIQSVLLLSNLLLYPLIYQYAPHSLCHSNLHPRSIARVRLLLQVSMKKMQKG